MQPNVNYFTAGNETWWLFPPQMLKCIELDEKLKSMDQEITVNPQFVQKVGKKLVNCIVILVLDSPLPS